MCSQFGKPTQISALIPSVSHLIEEWAVALVDPCPLGLPGSSDLDHRLDVHPWQLTSLNHLDPDLKARRKEEVLSAPSPPQETIPTAGFLGSVFRKN